MIFFVILKKDRGSKYPTVLTPATEIERLRKKDEYLIIAWNEVFPTREELQKYVMEVAAKDPICLDMRAQAMRHFGLDPFADEDAIDELFFYWSHPLVGNLVNSPRVRPILRAWQFVDNWHQCSFFDAATLKAISRLLTHAAPLGKASRDQCRIVYNVVELARAIIGELTAAPGRKLEKLLALQLVQSPKLLAEQRQMLKDYLAARGKRVEAATLRFGLEGWEYCRYYLPDDATTDQPRANAIPPADGWALAQVMIDTALGGKPKLDGCGKIGESLLKRCVEAWERIPHVIRCAALMNDFRKLDDVRKEVPDDETLVFKLSMCTPHVSARLLAGKPVPDDEFLLCASAGLKHVPVFRSTGRDLTWSWNRDEMHDVTVTYRRNLCPLWAGASGHTAGGIQFWMHVLGPKFPVSGARTVTAGLFTLWRLYYDKRVSGCHTMVETFEASCTSQVSGLKLVKDKEREAAFKFMPCKVPAKLADDAFDLLGQCAIFPGGGKLESIDPIFLFRLLQLKFCPDKSKVSGLKALIDHEREAIAKVFWLPQWSAELSVLTGTEVCSFTRGPTNTLVSGKSLSDLVLEELPDERVKRVVLEYASEEFAPTTITVRCAGEWAPRLSFNARFGAFQEVRARGGEPGWWTFTTKAFAPGAQVDYMIMLPEFAGNPDADDPDDFIIAYRQGPQGQVKPGTEDTVVRI